jgi:hypothetical protein
MIFWTFVVGPVTKRLALQENRDTLREISLRKGGLGWPSLIILIATGIYLLSYKGATLTVMTSGDFLATPFGQIISLKLLLVTGMIAYQAFVGHRAAPKLIFVNMLAAMIIIALSVLLVRAVKVGDPHWNTGYPEPFLKRPYLRR